MYLRRLVVNFKCRCGQDLIEWILLAGLFSAVAVAGIPNLAPHFKARLDRVIAVLEKAASI